MPDPGRRLVHRFRDHVVAGVNWRPTRFVDEAPSSRVCGLCRMIPKRMVLLPCGHALCQSCYAAISQGGDGRCSLDQEPFEAAECHGVDFPARKASSLKVYCWNEAHGCEYTGTMDRMLEHYENECTFHSVECLRCGERVQHSDLPKHYAAGCTAGVPCAITEFGRSEHTALTIEDVSAALEDLKAILGDPNHDQLHPVIQSQLNELTDQVRNQEVKFAEITRELRASEQNLKDEMDQIAAMITSTVPHQPNPEAQASTSSLSLRSEKAMILRKLEHLAHQSHDVLERLRQTFLKPDASRVIAYCKPLDYRIRHFTSALPTTAARVKAIGSVSYVLTLENYDEMIQWKGELRKFAEITVWHMRDACFTLAVKNGFSSSIYVDIEFNGMLVNSRCLPPFWRMRVRDAVKEYSLCSSRSVDCSCKFDKDTSAHFHVGFNIHIGSMNIGPPIRDGKMQFWIELNYE